MRFLAFLPAITWFIISAVLLALPGNNLPHNDIFNIPYFDKYVHFIMFLMLTSLFSYPFCFINENEVVTNAWFTRIAMWSIIYGVLMEFVQKYLVYGRSFDITDIVFDTIGSLVGFVIIRTYYSKKIGPNRNRGRNQN